MQNVLVTGNAGFIGTNLTEKLVNYGYEVKGIDNLCTGVFKNIHGDIDMTYDSITNIDSCMQAVKDSDVVIHLAASSGVEPSVENPIANADTNIMGTLNLLKQCVDANVKKFIFASSGGTILGAQDPPVHEESSIKPISPYGAAKAACEHYCNAFNKTYGLNTTILRFSNVYGPHSLHKQKNLIPAFILSCLDKNKSFEIYGDGNQTRDFIYVKDLVEAIYKILTHGDSLNGEIFQIATGKETQVNEIVNIMNSIYYKKTGRQKNIVNGDKQIGDVEKNYAMINKARNILNWEPKYSLKDGLLELFDYYL